MIDSSVFNSVSAKSFLYFGSSFSTNSFTPLAFSLNSALTILIVFSFTLSTVSKASVTSLLTSSLIESKFSSTCPLKTPSLSSNLTSDSEINFLYFGTSKSRKDSTELERFTKSSLILSTVLPLMDDTLDSILDIDSSTKEVVPSWHYLNLLF